MKCYTSKDEVIAELCKLVSQVSIKVMGPYEHFECFCSENPNNSNYRMNCGVIDFIKKAVNEAIEAKNDYLAKEPNPYSLGEWIKWFRELTGASLTEAGQMMKDRRNGLGDDELREKIRSLRIKNGV